MDYPGSRYEIINDPHLPRTSTWWIDRIYQDYFQTTATIRRLIQPAVEPVCTHSYIISQTGARKLLYHTNMFLPWGVDVAIIKLINMGTIQGYSIIPPLFVCPPDTLLYQLLRVHVLTGRINGRVPRARIRILVIGGCPSYQCSGIVRGPLSRTSFGGVKSANTSPIMVIFPPASVS
jgi:hypothetical protein